MNDQEIKKTIEAALKKFPEQPLADAALQLFEVLGYTSQKRLKLAPNTLNKFLATFAHGKTLNERYALPGEWKSIDFLFQLTDDEIRAAANQKFTFESKGAYNGTVINSYLFFALELKGSHYTRTALAGITREFNKLFAMPVLVLFRHGGTVTLAVINRRPHKRDEGEDVLEKVTLIKDIRLVEPHRAHIEILFDLSLGTLHDRHGFTNFVELQAAWQKTLDTSTLNKRFYQDLANWYFWALAQVRFPKQAPKDAEGHDSLSLIRLITRVIFCWFLKEKGLLPDMLFDPRKAPALLNDLSPKESTYYKAILQNLFFATLNQEMDKREFRKNGQNFMAHNLYRYRRLLKNPDETLKLFASIPFMNGGLFECLDKVLGTKEKPDYVRIDGFSDRDDNSLTIPNDLFFGAERIVDLSHAYGDKKFKSSKVMGLIHILDHYKFTIAENTPIEEEIALDPELLGKVFENLLAAYNPETGATARKQTGSFYTPREIVNYMVDEALIACLKTKLETAQPGVSNVEGRLRHLFAYNDQTHQFEPSEVDFLIEAIDHLKILDPACGSGAFPMGILHKLVFVLGKLDPGNQRWKARQLAKAAEIPDVTVRERVLADIEQTFGTNELDYGRKLYLIENCIYGVDIQPIAVQISKLRFFISLVVNQKMNHQTDNLGIRPLPNLETKFVAANSLIAIEKQHDHQFNLLDTEILPLRQELTRVRHDHFNARTPSKKRQCRERDTELRNRIAELLQQNGLPAENAKKLASWNPYNQNASGVFFDLEWMFGMLEGFDVVIGNPPYVSALDFARIYGNSLREQLNERYESATGAYDIFVLFIEQGIKLCKKLGHLSFITPNKYLAAKYAVGIRGWILKHASLQGLLDVSSIPVFEEAAVYPVVSLLCKDGGASQIVKVSLPSTRNLDKFSLVDYTTSEVRTEWLQILPENIWGFLLSKNLQLLPKIMKRSESLAQLGEVNATSTAAESDEYGSHLTSTRGTDGLKVINTGTIDKYTSLWGVCKMTHAHQQFLTPFLPLKKAAVNSRRMAMYKEPKVIFAKMAKTCEAVIDVAGEFASLNTNCFYRPRPGLSLKYVGGLCNTQMFMFLYDLFFCALRMSGGYYQFQAPQLRVIPIAKADKGQQSAIEGVVDQILLVKAKDPHADTDKFEKEIDSMVYTLYGLTPEEIKIVEDTVQ